jgi:hypothetical protein
MQVSAGDRQTCAITPTRRLDCWGGNPDGQTTGQTGLYYLVSAGWKHTCGITIAGVIDCWGSNQFGQSADQTSGSFLQVSAASGHTCALTAVLGASCWGDNFNGRADDQPGPYGPYEPWAEVTVKKVVVGNPPATPWAFSGDLGNFTLPAAGGEQAFPLTPGQTVTVSETDRPGWAATVVCTGGQTGIASVTLTVNEAVAATCTFTNTLCQPGTYDNGTICKAADPGYYVPGAGATEQLKCPAGTTSNGGASACHPIGTTAGKIFIPMSARQ